MSRSPRFLALFCILAVILASCANPTATEITPSVPSKPAATPIPTTAPSKPPATVTAPAQPPAVPIVYYHFVAIASNTFPAGSVVILPEVLILAPTLSNIARSPDPTANIGAALQAMIDDPRNAWTSDDLAITSLTFKDGTAEVVLQGKIFGAGDIVHIAARWQILTTVFAEAAVQTAIITLNGESIANMGISHSSEAKPAGYAYTRAEIETFMTENAYQAP